MTWDEALADLRKGYYMTRGEWKDSEGKVLLFVFSEFIKREDVKPENRFLIEDTAADGFWRLLKSGEGMTEPESYTPFGVDRAAVDWARW